MPAWKKVWRLVCGVAAAVLVVGHTGALIGGAINRLLAGQGNVAAAPKYNSVDRVVGSLLTATGTLQRWHMFSPNVGGSDWAPVLVITLKDRSRVLIHSPATPPMIDPAADLRFDAALGPDQSRMEWVFHFNDGRRRKLDTRILDPVAGKRWMQSTTYARWMLCRYLRDNPGVESQIKCADLYGIEVVFYGDEPLPRRGRYYYSYIYPQFDPLWPRGVPTSIKAPLPPP